MKTLAFMGGMLLLAVGGVMMWQKMYPTYTYRYRLTVEIDTPEGVKSGSSIYEVETQTFPRWMRILASGASTIKGEPIYIDLGEERNVVVLMLHGIWPKNNKMNVLFPYAVFAPPCDRLDYLNWAKEISQIEEETVILEEILIPNIVLFSNKKSPSNVKMLYQTGYEGMCWENKRRIINNFSSFLGEGYKLKSAELSLTNNLPEKKMHEIFPWWDKQQAQQQFWEILNKKEHR